MPPIDRRSFQFHGIDLFELMSERARASRSARRSRRRLMLIWLGNRLLIVGGPLLALAAAWRLATLAHGVAGVVAAAAVAVLMLSLAGAVGWWLRGSVVTDWFRKRERLARQKLARRRSSLLAVNEQLRARAPKDAAD